MDDKKMIDTSSIRYQITMPIVSLMIAYTILSTSLAFLYAFHEAREYQDENLYSLARLKSKIHSNMNEDKIVLSPYDGEDEADEEEVVMLFIYSNKSAVKYGLPLDLGNGFHDINIKNQSYRALLFSDKNGNQHIVMQSNRARNEIAIDSAFFTLLPLPLLIPILAIFIYILVKRSIKPIDRIGHELSLMKDHTIHPIARQNIPTELQPFINSINYRIEQVKSYVKSQRQFIENAAHEMRSPITALTLQADNISCSNFTDTDLQRFKQLKSGILRSRRLLEQLLSLAKNQHIAHVCEPQYYIHTLLTKLIEELLPIAEERSIEIEVHSTQNFKLTYNSAEISIILRNLILNAIQHTPEHGKVEVSFYKIEENIGLTIEDNGPGIPLAKREKVFQPFYRISNKNNQGSGLGLSIVKTIANSLGIYISLENSKNYKTGLRVVLEIPTK